MSHRCFAFLGVLAMFVAVATVHLGGQAPASGAAAKPAETWTAPRTPFGHPDLQGVWSHNSATPFQRPKELAGRQFLTDAELAAVNSSAAELFNGETDAAFGDSVFLAALRSVQGGDKSFSSSDTTGNYNQFWLVDREFDNRTSLIVDPPDGRMPLTADAQERQAAARERRRAHSYNGPEDTSLGLRCITGTVPMVGAGYNNYYQIAQTPDYVAINMEMRHDTRIIPLDGRPHLDKDVRQWLGDARGHWEGDTLVVDTTNFNDKTEFAPGGRIAGDQNMHLIERFTRTAQDTLKYEVTVDDPTVYSRPWTAVLFFKTTTDSLYEYACHEGNISMVGALSGARALERAAEEAAKSQSK